MSNDWPVHRIGASLLAVLVLAFAGWVLQHFLLSIAWAGVLAVATWPVFLRWDRRWGSSVAAALVTTIVAICTIIR